MTSGIRTVALCSPTGKIGPLLLAALQNEGFDVTVVLRDSSIAVFPEFQKIIRVSDGYAEDELVRAFSGQDAVVLSLSFEQLPNAKKFAVASITAGCQWLIASTYAANLKDPHHALFPASTPHCQAVDELQELQKGRDSWAWTSISCGPWAELAIAAGAWQINAKEKTAELVEVGKHVFTSSTRKQVALAAARVLKKRPEIARNKSVYISSFEVSMATWSDAYKRAVGKDGWVVSDIGSQAPIDRSNAQFGSGQFHAGYMGLALAVCTGPGYQNRFSEVATLANEELGLPQEDLDEVVREGLALPNPFA